MPSANPAGRLKAGAIRSVRAGSHSTLRITNPLRPVREREYTGRGTRSPGRQHYVDTLTTLSNDRIDAATAPRHGGRLTVATADSRTVLRDLKGAECPWTEDCSGTLERKEYKGDDALVCPDCDTPIVRVW